MSDNDQKEFTVTWSLQVDAYNAEHAATKASDLLRSRQPIAFVVFRGTKKRDAVTIIPRLEEHISASIKRFFPACEVEVEPSEEDYIVTVTSDLFRDIPNDQERMDMVAATLSGLPQDELDKIYYNCYTFDEFDTYGPGFEDDKEEDSEVDPDDPESVQRWIDREEDAEDLINDTKSEPEAVYGNPLVTKSSLT